MAPLQGELASPQGSTVGVNTAFAPEYWIAHLVFERARTSSDFDYGSANITLELYPPYLASQGVDVPPVYLDGSLLRDDWVPRPGP